MRKLRWQLLIAVGGIVVLLGYLFGQSPIIEPEEPEPISGGIYREALIGQVSRLNPVLDSYNQVDRDIDRLLYRGLVRFDSRGIPIPDLAESWAVSADATLYTFTIRADALWHDGEPVRSDDVIYTFSRYQDPAFPGPSDLQQLWAEVNMVRLDDKTIQFQLPEPYAPFLDFLSIGLLPDHLLRGVGSEDLIDHPFNLAPIGNGPFQFARFLLEEGSVIGIELSAFEEFYEGSPYLESIEFYFYPDEASAFQAYLDEKVMGISRVSPPILAQILKNQDLNLHSNRLPRIGTVFLNLNHPEKTFFAEKLFRKALMHALKRQYLIDDVLFSQAIVASGPIFSGTWAYLDNLEIYSYDINLAEEMLDSLGWETPVGANRGSSEYLRQKEGEILRFELIHSSDPIQKAIAISLKESWELIGIQVDLQPVANGDLFSDRLETRKFQAVLSDLNFGRFPDPDPYPFWHDSQVENGQNYGGFSDRNIGIWLEKARTTPDLLTRTNLYKNFQFRFQDQLPALVLYSPIYNYAIDADVQGVRMGSFYDPSDRFSSILEWHFLFSLPSLSPPSADSS